jgi:hypothetical protein
MKHLRNTDGKFLALLEQVKLWVGLHGISRIRFY